MTSAESHPPPAPFLLRGMARALDLGVLLLVMDLAYRCSRFLPSGGLFDIGDEALFWVDIGVGVSTFVTYTAVAEWLGSATFGKHCTGLRVASADGSGPIGLPAALIRNLAFYVDSLFLGIVAYSTIARSVRGQRLGDHWGRTVVLRRADAPEINAFRGWPVGMIAAFTLVMASYLLAS